MAVAIMFNHWYTLDGVEYQPGNTLIVDETVASPLLYSGKARLTTSDQVTVETTRYVTVADSQALVADQVDAYAAANIDGRSAYQIAVDDGFVGTEQEWLDSLQGDPGDLMPAQSFSTSGTFTLSPTQLPSTLRLALTGNTTIAFSATAFPATLSGTITLILKQAPSGGPYSVTWPVAIEWTEDATGPAMPSQAAAEVVVHLFWTGSGWRGVTAGFYYP